MIQTPKSIKGYTMRNLPYEPCPPFPRLPATHHLITSQANYCYWFHTYLSRVLCAYRTQQRFLVLSLYAIKGDMQYMPVSILLFLNVS